MKKTSIKNILFVLFALALVSPLSSYGNGKASEDKDELSTLSFISPLSLSEDEKDMKAMKAIEGKDGLFAILETEKGEVALELFYDKTPMTVANFVGLAEGTLDVCKGKPFYEGLKFHRVIENFMAQGGDPQGNGTGGPGYKFPDEFVEGLEFNKEGKLAMANSGPATNGSQFFITREPTEWLNGKHTIFGEVVEGQDVVNKIAQDDHIKSIKIIRNGDNAEKFVVDQAFFDKKIEENVEREAARPPKIIADFTKGFKKSEDGIYYQILEATDGEVCGNRRMVKVEYQGYFIDGKVFDATKGMNSKGHASVCLYTGGGQMITGFEKMVSEMKLGETRRMVIPPQLAWGKKGYPGHIPPNSYVCYDVKVISYK